MALKPSDAGSGWRGDREHGLDHEDVLAVDRAEQAIDSELAVRDPREREYRFKLMESLTDKQAGALERRYRAVGWDDVSFPTNDQAGGRWNVFRLAHPLDRRQRAENPSVFPDDLGTSKRRM